MISYVDILTILLVFFLVAAAKSAQSKPPRAPSPVPPCPVATKPVPDRQTLLRAQDRLSQHGLESKLEGRGLVISLSQVILFSSGEDTMSPDAQPTLERIADVLRDISNNVQLVGHADPVPIHNLRFRNNWDLSMARSRQILELLCARYGIAESRLSIASYGTYRPAAPNDTEDGRASNRRVEIVILDALAANDGA